jgi:hypothetical protein
MPRPEPTSALPPTPYDEQQPWGEMWQACVTVLDRYPHVRPAAPLWPPVLRHVDIPQAAVDAADRHYHFD